jgi:hypothetical protein
MPWILALCFADGVFKDYDTPEQLWNQVVPGNRESWEIRYKEEFLDWHVFRPRSASREPFTTGDWDSIWHKLLLRAGYPSKVTIHRIRQEASMLVDGSGATALQHEHLLGQSRPVAANFYRHNVTSIDLQSLSIGEPQRIKHITDLQGFKRTRIGGLPTCLPPSRAAKEIRASEAVMTLYEIRAARIREGSDVRALDSEISTARRSALNAAYKTYLREWIEQDYQLSLGNAGSRTVVEEAIHRSRLTHYLACSPAHDRVAKLIIPVRPTTDRHLRLVCDLIELAVEDVPQAYLPHERPVAGYCPVPGCKASMAG